MIKLYDFQETNWYAFAGAESFSKSKPPKIGEGKNYLVVFDANGIEIFIGHEEDDETWHKQVELTPALAEIIAAGLPESMDGDTLNSLGFYPI